MWMFNKNQSFRIKANEDLSSLRDNCIVAPAYNAYNDIVFFCKNYYYYYYIYSYEKEFLYKLHKDEFRSQSLLISLTGILIMFCQLIIQTLLTGFYHSINIPPTNLK